MAYIPTLGGAQPSGFDPQFRSDSVTPISLSTTIINMLSNDGQDQVVSHASGFMWRQNEKIFLVTARHVLSGRDPFSGEVISQGGYIPRRIQIFPTIEHSPGHWVRWAVKGDLYADDQPEWLEDPLFEQLRTDIAAIEIDLPPNGQSLLCMNDGDNLDSPLASQVGFECAVVGYPQSSIGGLMTPVWRRGTIASEPFLPVDGKPMFLLDASTSPGFSGSPVFRRHIGPAPLHQGDELIIDLDSVVRVAFVGVYAGRLAHSHFGGEVPFVFYANRLPHILALA